MNKYSFQIFCNMFCKLTEIVYIIKTMGNFISKIYKVVMNEKDIGNGVLVVGKEKTKIFVSLNILLDNFGYFKSKSCFKIADKSNYKLPEISESTMLSVLHFIEKGELLLMFN